MVDLPPIHGHLFCKAMIWKRICRIQLQGLFCCDLAWLNSQCYDPRPSIFLSTSEKGSEIPGRQIEATLVQRDSWPSEFWDRDAGNDVVHCPPRRWNAGLRNMIAQRWGSSWEWLSGLLLFLGLMGETGECWASWVNLGEKLGVCECWDISHACPMMLLDKHLQAFAIGMTWGPAMDSHMVPVLSCGCDPRYCFPWVFTTIRRTSRNSCLLEIYRFCLGKFASKNSHVCSLRSIAKS